MIALHETLTLGSIIVGILVSLSILVSVVYGAKWKVAAEVAEANAAAWKDSAHRLEEEIAGLKQKVEMLRRRVAELESLPDMTKLLRELQSHEVAAASRWDASLEVLSEIRDSLVSLKSG